MQDKTTTASIPNPEANITFSMDEHGVILTITAEGKLITGEGLHPDEATQHAAKILCETFDEHWSVLAKKYRKTIVNLEDQVADLSQSTEYNKHTTAVINAACKLVEAHQANCMGPESADNKSKNIKGCLRKLTKQVEALNKHFGEKTTVIK